MPRRARRARRARADDRRPSSKRDVEAEFAREQRRREQCRAKQWFATESEARAIALMTRTQWGEDRLAYRCDVCGGWHLASGGGGGAER